MLNPPFTFHFANRRRSFGRQGFALLSTVMVTNGMSAANDSSRVMMGHGFRPVAEEVDVFTVLMASLHQWEESLHAKPIRLEAWGTEGSRSPGGAVQASIQSTASSWRIGYCHDVVKAFVSANGAGKHATRRVSSAREGGADDRLCAHDPVGPAHSCNEKTIGRLA
jgi:hypothetical protein